MSNGLDGASSSSINNPFTYRGYYFDKDLGLYYLNSRYYDSNTGRFVNADGQLNIDSILGYNLFAYCENNPISFVDYNGDFPFLAIGAAISSAATAFVVTVVIVSVAHVVSKAAVCVGEKIADAIENVTDKTKEAPKNVTEPEDDAKDEETQKSLPTEGEPNSDSELYDENGVKQRRHYGPDGKAEYDIDFRHGGSKHKFPHKHYWDWSKSNPRGLGSEM